MTTFTGTRRAGEPRASPRALIVSIYGLYARDRADGAGGWLSVASLIRLMGGLGADQAAVRSSISRLKQRGILEPLRLSGAAGYALSDRGTEILAEGDRRIFERPRARLADGWLLAVFSVPERERAGGTRCGPGCAGSASAPCRPGPGSRPAISPGKPRTRWPGTACPVT